MAKIIDEKGRVFGKINIIDLAIVCVVLIVCPVFFYGYSTLKEKPLVGDFKWIAGEAVTFTIPEIARLFKPGDLSYDRYGKPDAELLEVLEKDEGYGERIKQIIRGQSAENKYRIPVFLRFRLACTKNPVDNFWYYHGKSVFVGLEDNFLFDTEKYRIWCHALTTEDK